MLLLFVSATDFFHGSNSSDSPVCVDRRLAEIDRAARKEGWAD
jgi:hypothetical protein